MTENFKALGCLFTFRYINDVEDMDLDDLQDIYNDLEGEYKELKSELDKLKDVIDKRNPEELREKKRKKNKTANELLGNEDIPYEVRMKHIINAYRKDQKSISKLEGYAKHLEGEVIRLKEIMIANGYSDDGVLGDSEPIYIIKRLRREINELHIKLKEQKGPVELEKKIKILEEKIENVYPKRKYKVTTFQRVIKSQELYIKALQKLLDENGIPYHPRIPVNDLEAKGADSINVNAVR